MGAVTESEPAAVSASSSPSLSRLSVSRLLAVVCGGKMMYCEQLRFITYEVTKNILNKLKYVF